VTRPQREGEFLAYIRDSINLLQGYLPKSYAEFEEDALTQDAVMWRLMTLTDAASKRLSQDLKARHPNVPWATISGFRNVAAHGYANIDLKIVWGISTRDLSVLLDAVKAELA
jgi:uncharacterized protein with HEPN domain